MCKPNSPCSALEPLMEMTFDRGGRPHFGLMAEKVLWCENPRTCLPIMFALLWNLANDPDAFDVGVCTVAELIDGK